MSLTKAIFLFGLLTALTANALDAKEVPISNQRLNQAYLSHWFSYDSAEAINLTLTPLEEDSLGERAEIRFTSDDGQAVNGLIGFPKDKASSNKLALALHPMGIDQQFWWSDTSPLAAQKMTARLREQGYTVISLDARLHGERGRQGFGPRELIKRAHSAEPRLYIDTIIGSVRDYRIVLNWAKTEFSPDQVLVMGYSMGAQMSLLLASFEPSVGTVVAMVPPFVGSPTSPVAPRVHVQRITDAKVLWLAGRSDPHSDRNQTQETFDQISSIDKTLTWFDAGHRLPPEFLDTALSFFDSLGSGLHDSGLRSSSSPSIDFKIGGSE
ncbi:MAG: alpha/beta fold hydrolase [Arenicella sp.]|nr:alpha/beta fold hydrolase [Arenicella sp.]